MDVFTSWSGLWSKRDAPKRLLSGEDETDEETAIDYDDNDAAAKSESRPVAVFSILPPDRVRGGRCVIDEEWLESNEKQPRKLQDDPVALCVTGRFSFCVNELCREHPATEHSTRDNVVFWGVLIAFLMVQIPILVWLGGLTDYPRIYILRLAVIVLLVQFVAEWAHRTSPELSGAQTRFRDAIRDVELKAGFASMLGECGYRHELHQASNGPSDGGWRLFLYPLEGAEQRLPAASTLQSLQEDEAFEKVYDLYQKIGVIEHRKPPHNEDRKEENTLNDASIKDTVGPLDLWTFWGLIVGRRMNRMACTTSTRLWKLGYLLYLIPILGLVHGWYSISLYLAGMGLGFLLLAAVVHVTFRVFDLPHYEAANARMAKALDPLVRKRHGGYGLSFRPVARRCLGLFDFNTGTFVLEPPGTTLVEVPVVV